MVRLNNSLEKMTRLSVACGLIWMLFVVSTTDAYSKYGRSCKDIGCRSNEVCVMEEEPCTIYKRDNCGRYPTCKKSSEAGEQTCTTMICPAGQYCKTENGRPTCVNTMPGLAPAARRPGRFGTTVTTTTRKPATRYNYNPQRPTLDINSDRNGYGGSIHGRSGSRNTIGNNSLWDRLFGDRDSNRRSNNNPHNRPSNNLPSNNNNYASHVTTDKNGNRVWTFSG